ncbi:probable methyltransferase-like protein 25 [Harmonia axyridis]|uniref:probable methyltransferase-like protein 25 n=1 Tax=Harmonia axyridis TaxID=115357 RepID=UPI001E279510|nr:probable methyltransferase-like protein 25 [Harmonia axyridis]XP_045461077.1 probable methyltransferase-like protein 25 [Harmonia axyridis]
MSYSTQRFDSSKYFDEALAFLKEYMWIYNSPNTDILSRNVLDQIPHEWIVYFQKLSFSDLKDLSLGKKKDDCPHSLVGFLDKIELLSTPRKRRYSESKQNELPKKGGLSFKKQHEVISFAPLIADICDRVGTNQVIDIGAGLGYLSYLLAEDHKCSVLAIEGCPQKMESALKYQLKYHKYSRERVTFYNHFITENSVNEINKSLNNTFSKEEAICMCGLHACADLSVTILDLFLEMDQVKSLVIMPCCYHRLGLRETVDEREYFKGFPISEALKYYFEKYDASNFLKRPFLRLACQTTSTTFQEMSDSQHEEHAKNFLMRGILQKAADEVGCNVSRLKRKSGKSLNESDFSFYLKNFCNNYKLIPKSSDAKGDLDVERRIIEIWESNQDKLILMEALTALQTSLQSVCENILLQDKVQYLIENGVNCYIEKVTDDNISPRCHALIAIKN